MLNDLDYLIAHKKITIESFIERPYLLFVGTDTQPLTPWEEYRGRYETVVDAEKVGEKMLEEEYGWYQIVDIRREKEVGFCDDRRRADKRTGKA